MDKIVQPKWLMNDPRTILSGKYLIVVPKETNFEDTVQK